MNLTQNEKTALKAAFESARGNGHDFGFVEDIVKTLTRSANSMTAQAVGALVTSLSKKNILTVHEAVITNNGGPGNRWTQFTWNVEVEQVEKMIAEAPANTETKLTEEDYANLREVRLEITRINKAAGQTIFNPAATQALEAVMRKGA